MKRSKVAIVLSVFPKPYLHVSPLTGTTRWLPRHILIDHWSVSVDRGSVPTYQWSVE